MKWDVINITFDSVFKLLVLLNITFEGGKSNINVKIGKHKNKHAHLNMQHQQYEQILILKSENLQFLLITNWPFIKTRPF